MQLEAELAGDQAQDDRVPCLYPGIAEQDQDRAAGSQGDVFAAAEGKEIEF